MAFKDYFSTSLSSAVARYRSRQDSCHHWRLVKVRLHIEQFNTESGAYFRARAFAVTPDVNARHRCIWKSRKHQWKPCLTEEIAQPIKLSERRHSYPHEVLDLT